LLQKLNFAWFVWALIFVILSWIFLWAQYDALLKQNFIGDNYLFNVGIGPVLHRFCVFGVQSEFLFEKIEWIDANIVFYSNFVDLANGTFFIEQNLVVFLEAN
jgi:hypothetical protein